MSNPILESAHNLSMNNHNFIRNYHNKYNIRCRSHDWVKGLLLPKYSAMVHSYDNNLWASHKSRYNNLQYCYNWVIKFGRLATKKVNKKK